MRDICFRGQQNDTREWRYGSFAQVDGDAFIISPFSKMNDEYGVTVPDCVQVLRETAGEFTGLVDQNGKQIFEGDIVKGGNQYNESHCGTVSFGRYRNWASDDSYNTGFFIKWADCKHWREELAYWVEERKIEVIGNIHDAPELLKEAVQ